MNETWNSYEAVRSRYKILEALSTSDGLRFSEIHKKAAGVSTATLSIFLKESDGNEVVKRDDGEYKLTLYGDTKKKEYYEMLAGQYKRYLRRSPERGLLKRTFMTSSKPSADHDFIATVEVKSSPTARIETQKIEEATNRLTAKFVSELDEVLKNVPLKTGSIHIDLKFSGKGHRRSHGPQAGDI